MDIVKGRIGLEDKFLYAGKCTGTHLHLEVPPGVVDSRVAVSYKQKIP